MKKVFFNFFILNFLFLFAMQDDIANLNSRKQLDELKENLNGIDQDTLIGFSLNNVDLLDFFSLLCTKVGIITYIEELIPTWKVKFNFLEKITIDQAWNGVYTFMIKQGYFMYFQNNILVITSPKFTYQKLQSQTEN
ncbi:hypothetical protein M1446_00745 [Candidatus Dependentiae bacterium]|nr:hypothetical protein [Candidatus Dependentiae bacterium]